MKQDKEFAPTEARKVYEKLNPIFDGFKDGSVKREDADTATNIAGKQLKALSIIVASRALDEGHQALQFKMKSLPSE